jgi:hypothetical protein
VNLDIGSHTKRAKLATTQSKVEMEGYRLAPPTEVRS